VIDKLNEKTGVNIKVNRHSDFIFNDNMQDHVKTFLERDFGKDRIAEYAFARLVHNHKVAKEKGAATIRHCPLVIRLGATVNRDMGHKGGLYDLVAKIAGLPSAHNLRRYTVSNSNDEDGIMYSCCSRARSIFNLKNNS
jgi:hypothetical protein